jgi:hypothetical protein
MVAREGNEGSGGSGGGGGRGKAICISLLFHHTETVRD